MTYHLLAKEIFLQGTFASDVVLQGYVSVRTESTGKHANVHKDTLEHMSDSVIRQEPSGTDLKWFV